MNFDRCFAPAPRPRFRGRETSLAWCCSCHKGPTSVTSSAITSAGADFDVEAKRLKATAERLRKAAPEVQEAAQ